MQVKPVDCSPSQHLLPKVKSLVNSTEVYLTIQFITQFTSKQNINKHEFVLRKCILSIIITCMSIGILLQITRAYQGRIRDFKLGGAHIKNCAERREARNFFEVFRVKNHDFTPKKLYFFQFPPAGSTPAYPKTRTLSTDIHVSELTCIPKNNSFVEIYPLFKARVHSQKSKSYIHRSPRFKAHVHLRGGGALKKNCAERRGARTLLGYFV